MIKSKQEIIDAVEHISFEMNRYLYTANPAFLLPGRYREVVAESCLLHSRNIGEFFFDNAREIDDIRIDHYYDELISKDELANEIDKSKSNWNIYKTRVNKSLSHLTYSRGNSSRVNMGEKNTFNFDTLIELFDKNLPTDFREKWNRGKSFSM